MTLDQFENNLSHSRVAYLHSVRSLPILPIKAPLNSGGLTFTKDSQVFSIVVELGWAFFCRYESCFETFLKESGVKLKRVFFLED